MKNELTFELYPTATPEQKKVWGDILSHPYQAKFNIETNRYEIVFDSLPNNLSEKSVGLVGVKFGDQLLNVEFSKKSESDTCDALFYFEKAAVVRIPDVDRT